MLPTSFARQATRVFFGLLGAALALTPVPSVAGGTASGAAAVAQATPNPEPTKKPSPFRYGGYVRSFDFSRLNNPQLSSKNALNQRSWNTGVNLHGEYDLAPGLTFGATYFYANPFAGNCNSAASHANGAPCVNSNKQKPGQGTNPDDTLPGFEMSTLYETYLQYKDPHWYVKGGDQVINTPWAAPIDTRLKPVAFRGGDAAYTFDKHWTAEYMRMTEFEGRAESNFENSTLLTATKIASANYGGAPSNLDLKSYTSIPTNGFNYGRIGYANGNWRTNLHYYNFLQIANAFWLEGQYSLNGSLHPALAYQLGSEHETGSAVIGKIDSQIYGVQGGITPHPNLSFTVGFDAIPERSTTLVLPKNVTCSSSGSITAKSPLLYFIPTGGTPACHNLDNGQTVLYYGGWASPYTSGYTGDPLFTTTISSSMIDRASPGQSVKGQLTAYADLRRIRLIVSQGYYSFGNPTTGLAPTREFNADATFCPRKMSTTGACKGLQIRYRYADRLQAPAFATNPEFKYNRGQLEYDF
ncbi:MAG: hypothetical protein JO060_03595 [Candidatus Eremiobacteraeota bacterium]|nr:hypothetical protein [Candidatus Eremiobacteraeota bacterium]MBV9647072.1 hypothetical protein [Candidatus Eremiobacteraeota bacterium]